MSNHTRRAILRRIGGLGVIGAGFVGTGHAAEPNTIIVAGGGSGAVTYEFEVSGEVSRSTSPSGDYTDGSRAWGTVYGWRDGYEFTGEITSFTHDNPATVYINGAEVDPESLGSPSSPAPERHTIVVANIGSDGPVTYEFGVSGSVAVGSSPSGDYTDGSRAWGTVYGWRDGYEYTGDITSFTYEGTAQVFIDGMEVDPDSLGGGGGGEDPPEEPPDDPDSPSDGHLHDMDDWSDWGPYTKWSNGSVGPTTSDVYEGASSLHLTSTGGRLGATYQPPEPIDLSGKRFSLAVRATFEDARWSEKFTLYFIDTAGRQSDYAFQYPLWMMGDSNNWLRVPVFKKPTSMANADFSSIETIRLSARHPGASECSIDDFRLHEQGEGRVLFTFDDGPASQQLAMDYMHDQGVPGTIFPVESYINRGTLSIDALKEAQANGWTVGVHPQRSDSLPEMSLSAAEAAMDEEAAWIESHGFDSNIMAWPYGAFDGPTLAAAEDRFDLAFSTGGTPTPTEISCPLNIGRSSGNSSDNDGDGIPDETKHAIDRAANYGETAVLNYHTIGQNDQWTTPLDHFQNSVDYAIQSEVSIVTASDLL